MAQVGQDNVKEKVQAVKEVVPGRSNNEMILVLQYYDYCVETTIQAYLEDGAKEALTEWHFSENKVSKNKKKKSKKSQSNQNQSNSQAQAANNNNNANARLTNGIVNGHVSPGINSATLIGKNVTRTGAVASSSSSSSSLSRGDSQVAASTSPKEEASSSASSQKDSNDSAAAASKSESATDNEFERHKHTIQSSKQNSAASTTSDTYHISQESNLNSADMPKVRQGVPQNSEKSKMKQKQKSAPKPTKPGLEKSSKDLHRQTVALERLQLVLTEEVDKSYKRIKTVFEEMHACLREREAQIMKEMDAVKIDAMETLKQRQQKAVDLREVVAKASGMSESEVAELRFQIKQYVSDRRIDDDLSRTTRFTYDSDHLAKEIKNFGEVIAVNKCAYSSSRPSTSASTSASISSSQDTLPPPIVPAQVLSTSANISMHSNDIYHDLSSEGATCKKIPNSDQQTSDEPKETDESAEKKNPEDEDQSHLNSFRILTNAETRYFNSRRRSARKNYSNTGNRDYRSGGFNQRGGSSNHRGRGGVGDSNNSGGYYNSSSHPQERIQYLGRGARRSRPYRGGGRGEIRGGFPARQTTQTVTPTASSNK